MHKINNNRVGRAECARRALYINCALSNKSTICLGGCKCAISCTALLVSIKCGSMPQLSRYHTLHVAMREMRIWPQYAAKCCKNAGKFFPDGGFEVTHQLAQPISLLNTLLLQYIWYCALLAGAVLQGLANIAESWPRASKILLVKPNFLRHSLFS